MAEKIYVVRKDILNSGYDGNLESVIVHNQAGAEVEIHNGVFVTLGALAKTRKGMVGGVQVDVAINDREVFDAKLTKAGDHVEEVYFVHNGEVMYDEKLYKLEDYRCPAGKVARAYSLTTGDILTFTADFFGATAPTVGDKLIVGANGYLIKDDTKLAEAKIVFHVIEDSGYELHQTAKAFAVRIVRK
ncbi:capsid stabilizing protein [Bacillus phage vB_BanS-Thrax5]|nr:capsid stabilizing protein [Bacillus phage vB_BanS-Thrax5]